MPVLILKILLFLIEIVIVIAILIISLITILPPKIKNKKMLNRLRKTVGNNAFVCGKCWLRKNRNNLFEMYIEGDAYERGLVAGRLTKELFSFQEEVFINYLKKKIPGGIKRFIIKTGIGIYNRKINKHIGDEFSKEIYGISKSASRKYSYIAPAYMRIMNYHAAHDIGHTLQDINYVGCTSVSLKGKFTFDNNLLIGRNFDFYVNDDFCRNKIVAFYRPSTGHPFAMVTWAGMIGVISGMNLKGITITINGVKSDIPKHSATPVSILAREILQYAGNLKEAKEIAQKRSIFVSELLMVSSADEKRTIIIEKTPEKTDVYENDAESEICTNHFQGDILKNEHFNITNIKESSTMYRYNRVNELLNKNLPFTAEKMAELLREKKGVGNAELGLSNEKAINQLKAHHSVIFIPEKLIMYVSASPYNLGEYMAYNINNIFTNATNGCPLKDIDDINLTIAADNFLVSGEFKKYEEYKKMLETLQTNNIYSNKEDDFFNTLCQLNPEYYLTYSSVGNYLRNNKRYKEAISWYSKSLCKEFHNINEYKKIKKELDYCNNHIRANA